MVNAAARIFFDLWLLWVVVAWLGLVGLATLFARGVSEADETETEHWRNSRTDAEVSDVEVD